MKTELEWKILPRGTHTAILNPIQLDCWQTCMAPGMSWHWTAWDTVEQCGVGCGDSQTELGAKDAATCFARNYLHPIVTEDKISRDFHRQIDDDISDSKMTDCDATVAWGLGLKAWKAAKSWGARFPHE